ncbi:peptidoglycan bridge formation glycyltransferase FemA/FemB family protein [soil metagenome]
MSNHPITASQSAWNASLSALGGHLLQSWEWGDFKGRHGWKPSRIANADGSGMAQVLFRHRGPVSVAYIPRGPALERGGSGSVELMDSVDAICKEHRSLYTLVEPNEHVPWADRVESDKRWRAGPDHIQPGRTVKIELADDDVMLKQMHQKTRYSVRLAMRKGVAVETFEGLDEPAYQIFYRLLSETSNRNEFGIHHEDYYRDFLHAFGTNALMLIARVDGEPAAGLIGAAFGEEAIYMYGGSSVENRAHGAAFLLQFEAMRWARDKGMKRYDLWGIPMRDPELQAEKDAQVPATRGDDWRGLHRFKTGFGGNIVEYPGALERVYWPLATKLAKRVNRGGVQN